MSELPEGDESAIFVPLIDEQVGYRSLSPELHAAPRPILARVLAQAHLAVEVTPSSVRRLWAGVGSWLENGPHVGGRTLGRGEGPNPLGRVGRLNW